MSKTTIPKKLRVEVLNRDGKKCLWCGRDETDGVKLHIDHIVPEHFGGKTTEDNLGTLCQECNLGKSADYFGSYLLETIFKVKNLDEFIIIKDENTRIGIDGRTYDGSWHSVTLTYYEEISKGHFVAEDLRTYFLVHRSRLGDNSPSNKIFLSQKRDQAVLELKNKLRDILFEKKEYLKVIEGMLVLSDFKT